MLCIAALSHADRQPGSLSTIKTSPTTVDADMDAIRIVTTGNIEVIHRLHNHDAEQGVIAVHGDRSLTLDKLEGRARLALYVEERFIVASVTDDGIGAPLALELVGAELDGDYILVYQEYNGELPTRIAVQNGILRDVFPEQVNHVNISTGAELVYNARPGQPRPDWTNQTFSGAGP